MRLGLAPGELSSALPLPSVALFPVSCAITCIMGKKSCNTKRASPITNSRLNDRSMRCVIYESNDFDQRQPELVLDCSRLRRANFLWPLHSPSNQKWRRGGTKGTVPSVLTYCGTQRAVLEVTYEVCALEARRDCAVRRTGSEPALHYTELRGFQPDLTESLTGGDCHDAGVALLACRIESLCLELVGSVSWCRHRPIARIWG